MDHWDLRTLMGRALSQGARRLSLARAAWDISGPCQAPVALDLQARPEAPRGHREVVVRSYTKTTLQLDLETRCRKCPACLRFRAALWTGRALGEYRASRRTWFGTITLRPEEHYVFSVKAEVRARDRGILPEEWNHSERFRATHDAIGRELTKYLKRVRKESSAPLRYLLVCEAHKSGTHHYHALVHEVTDRAVRERTLRQQWPFGFTKWKLIPEGEEGLSAARYVAKYLGKSALARVRASVRYGTCAPTYDLRSYASEGRGRAAPGPAGPRPERSFGPPAGGRVMQQNPSPFGSRERKEGE